MDTLYQLLEWNPVQVGSTFQGGGGKGKGGVRFMFQCPASFGFMDSDAVLGLCSVLLLRLAFECDQSLACFDFPTPLQPFFVVDPYVLDSLIELAPRDLDDVCAFVLKCSLDEDRWVLQYSVLADFSQDLFRCWCEVWSECLKRDLGAVSFCQTFITASIHFVPCHVVLSLSIHGNGCRVSPVTCSVLETNRPADQVRKIVWE